MLDSVAVRASPSGYSAASSSTNPSPAFDIQAAYNQIIHANPYSECWRITPPSNSVPFHSPESPATAILEDEAAEALPTLASLLVPAREAVNEKLLLAESSNSNRLVSNFFESSEEVINLFLDLYNGANLARKRYLRAALRDLSSDSDSDSDSLSQSQIDRAYDEFAQFYDYSNPFPSPEANNLNEIRQCFCNLKNNLNRRIRKSNSKIRLPWPAPFFCAARIPPKKDIEEQNKAARNLFALEHELKSLEILIKRLHNSVEAVRKSIRSGLDWGRDKHSTEEVLKQLRREQRAFLKQLESLKKHIGHCHGKVIETRQLLFDQVSSSTTTSRRFCLSL